MTAPPHGNRPAAVEDHYLYWGIPPWEPSARLLWWLDQIERGWRPNRRFRREGYDLASEMYGVYIWEYLNVLRPTFDRLADSQATIAN